MKLYALIISFLIVISGYGQVQDQLAESWLEQQENTADYTEAVPWSAFLQDPLNLNKASTDELLMLPAVSLVMAQHLVVHRENTVLYLNLLELQVIPGWDIPVIRQLLPMVTVGNAGQITLRQLLYEGKQQLNLLYTRDFQESKGYQGLLPIYKGDPSRMMINYRYQAQNRIYFGFTGEKDEGEPLINRNTNTLFDFQSMHLLVRPNRFVQTIALGDFQAAFGQGLAFGNFFSTGKSSWVLQTQQLQKGFRPYRSVNENEFLRGAAISLQYQQLTCDLFISSLAIDATTDEDAPEAGFSSTITTGLHRTDKEIARKDAVLIKQQGAHITYQGKSFILGLTTVNHRFSSSIVKELKPYQVFDFTGSGQFSAGADYRYISAISSCMEKLPGIPVLRRNCMD